MDDLRIGCKQCLQCLSAASAGQREAAQLYGCNTQRPSYLDVVGQEACWLKTSKTKTWNLKYFKVWNYHVSTQKFLDLGFRLVFRDQYILKYLIFSNKNKRYKTIKIQDIKTVQPMHKKKINGEILPQKLTYCSISNIDWYKKHCLVNWNMKLASFTLKILIQWCKWQNRTKTDMLKQGSAKTTSKSTREDQQKQQQAGGYPISDPTGRSPGMMQPEELGRKELGGGGSSAQRLGDL